MVMVIVLLISKSALVWVILAITCTLAFVEVVVCHGEGADILTYTDGKGWGWGLSHCSPNSNP